MEVLPGPLRTFSELIPQTHTLRAVRLLLRGESLASDIVSRDLASIALIAAVALPLGWAVLRRGMGKVKRDGYAPITGAIWFFG